MNRDIITSLKDAETPPSYSGPKQKCTILSKLNEFGTEPHHAYPTKV